MHGCGSLRNFVEKADTNDDCWNLLDFPCFIPESPAWMRYVHVRLIGLELVSSSLRHLRDGITALDMTIKLTYCYFDMWRQQNWELHTHGGFLTYPHHDAAGLYTYVYIKSGAKLWAVMRPDLKRLQSREDLFKMYDRLGLFKEYHSLKMVETILLERGDLL